MLAAQRVEIQPLEARALALQAAVVKVEAINVDVGLHPAKTGFFVTRDSLLRRCAHRVQAELMLIDEIGGQEITDLEMIAQRIALYFEPGRPARGKCRPS